MNEAQNTGTELSLSYKNLTTLNKGDISDIVASVKEQVAEGNQDALDALIIAKKLSALGKQLEDGVKDYAYAKTYATKGQPYVHFGAKVEAAEVGTEYDYSDCNDEQLTILTEKANEANKALKERQEFLKTLPKATNIVTDDGEIVTINPAIKKSKSGYKISIV